MTTSYHCGLPAAPGIYSLTCVTTGKIYIGSSTDMRRRVLFHLSLLRRGIHPNPLMQHAFNKYGAESFAPAVVEPCDGAEFVEREQHWTDVHRAAERAYGMNINPFSTRIGHTISDEQKRRVSEANKGKIVSDETRARLSAALRGKKHSPEHVAKLPQNSGGEKHPKARLTWAQVDEIRELCRTERTVDVARRFGVKGYVVSQIKHGKTWKTAERD